MDWNSFGAAITGAVVGGLITGFFAFITTRQAHKNQLSLSSVNDEKIISSFLHAIHDEIETVSERYQEAMGARLESLDEGQALSFYYPVVSDFFTVYNSNGSLISRVPNNDLRKQIIKTYTLSKGMIDSYRLNNELVSKWEYAENLYAETKLEAHKEQALAHYYALVNYAKSLKELHHSLKQEISILLRALRKFGALNEKNN